ncbi:hypothetical protein HPB48_021841 [Haemaphysalis longicornis]|uniref:Uncharacterized protein n=1 Tax=Haemaphysalis longicornis TaxID=44386 RepID=A0A9J6GVB4_HAELO|nr:hypothetical protein HPB48_021841 [Haemaphysalis longicornis]
MARSSGPAGAPTLALVRPRNVYFAGPGGGGQLVRLRVQPDRDAHHPTPAVGLLESPGILRSARSPARAAKTLPCRTAAARISTVPAITLISRKCVPYAEKSR